MTRSLYQAQAELDEQVASGRWPEALALCNDILAAVPTALAPRFVLADIYAKAGHHDHALHLYGLLADRCGQAGLPLLALVALKALEALGAPDPGRVGAWVQRYAANSPDLDKTAPRPSPPDPQLPVPLQPPLDSVDEAAQSAFARACLAEHLPEPGVYVAPLPLLSDMMPEALLSVYSAIKVQTFRVSQLLMQQGHPGDSLYLIALGEVVVFTTDAQGQNAEIARVAEGTLLGEMALVSAEPRSASVVAAGPVVAAVLESQALAALGRSEVTLMAVLDRFARERVLKNLLSTSPLFQPFSPEQRAQLLARFQGVQYEPGAVILPEGLPGPGLFIVLMGTVEVSSQTGGTHVPLARLHSSDVFGEMSLLGGGPTSATVVAVTPATTLFLQKDDFLALVEGIPGLLAHFATLANQRAAAQSVVLGRSGDLQGPDLLL